MIIGPLHWTAELEILEQMVPTIDEVCGPLSERQRQELQVIIDKQKERVLRRKELGDAIFEAIMETAKFNAGTPERIVADEKVRVLMDKMREGLVVHALHHGLPLCGFTSKVPGEWPIGHMWVGKEEASSVTCDGCKAKAQA